MSNDTKAKAKTAPPPPRTNKVQFSGSLGVEAPKAPEIPQLEVQRASAPSARYADLNFKVPDRFKRRYRQAAGVMGLKLNQVLQESFELWLAKNKLDHLTLPDTIDIGDEK